MEQFDVIIVGGGIGGLNTALNLDRRLKILLICKRELDLCNTSLAQGGIAAVYDTVHDSCEQHIHDTMIAGREENNAEAVKILSQESKEAVEKLMELGVEFDRDPSGSFSLTLEGGHSCNRILHHKDSTGKEIAKKLQEAVKQLDNITIWEYSQMCDLKRIEQGFSVRILRGDNTYCISAPFCVLATGGIGRIYKFTTNSSVCTGDGIAMAYNLGALIKNLSYVQFHPTAFFTSQRECFLISEAVRGNGAFLYNYKKERFMHRYDSRLELAPRDVVSQSIMKEQRATGHKEFYLDISHKDSDFIKNRFPMIYSNLLESGYDLTAQPVPIYPCQHYLMGGINVDINAQSNIKGLYAVGECSHTGVHGKNRLASNSLLEGMVFSRRAALNINEMANNLSVVLEPYRFKPNIHTQEIPVGTRTEIRSILQRSHFVVPNRQLAEEGFIRINDIKFLLDHGHFRITTDYVEARSLATCAYIILKEIM